MALAHVDIQLSVKRPLGIITEDSNPTSLAPEPQSSLILPLSYQFKLERMPLTTETAGASNGQNAHSNKQNGDSSRDNLSIVGLGHHYPPYTNALEDIEGYLAKFCDMETPA